MVDGDKVVRIQARRESELKLSEFMKFSMNWKIKKKPLMMRVCTRAGLGKYQAVRSADAGNSPRSSGKLGKEKCYVSSCGIFFRRQISFCVISGHLFMTKAFQ